VHLQSDPVFVPIKFDARSGYETNGSSSTESEDISRMLFCMLFLRFHVTILESCQDVGIMPLKTVPK